MTPGHGNWIVYAAMLSCLGGRGYCVTEDSEPYGQTGFDPDSDSDFDPDDAKARQEPGRDWGYNIFLSKAFGHPVRFNVDGYSKSKSGSLSESRNMTLRHEKSDRIVAMLKRLGGRGRCVTEDPEPYGQTGFDPDPDSDFDPGDANGE